MPSAVLRILRPGSNVTEPCTTSHLGAFGSALNLTYSIALYYIIQWPCASSNERGSGPPALHGYGRALSDW